MPTSQQRKKLRDALIRAFPDKSSIEQLLYFELDKNLNQITKDSNLEVIVFELIRTAETQGWLLDLVRAARKENPGNSDLTAIAQELLPPETPNSYKQAQELLPPEIPNSYKQAQELLPPETPNSYKQKILVLADASSDEDTQKIELAIKRAVKPDSFEIKVRTVISPQDIRRAVGEERPSIVHFCCHGTEDGNLVLKDNEGNDKPVLRAVLADLFKLYASDIKWVLLNVPYSFQSAQAISQHINYVICLEQSIQESTAIVFAEGFYNGLGYDDLNNSYAIQRAFNEGILALKLDCSKGIMPDLWKEGILHDEDLSSDHKVDYTKLRDFLRAGQWFEANEETFAVMFKASGRETEGWRKVEDIKNFPCTDLRIIDQLWVEYSDGRFGFSVQKRIWESVDRDEDKFEDRIGWRIEKGWWMNKKKRNINYNEATFDTEAPEGHLPIPVGFPVCGGYYQYRDVFSRVKTCKL